MYSNRKDRKETLNLIIETWDYYGWVPRKAVKAMGAYYLYEILSESSAAWVAEVDGQFAGIAAAADKSRRTCHPYYRLCQWLAYVRILLGRVGIDEFFQFVKTQDLDKELLSVTGKKFDAELTLLIAKGNCKGHGIGGALYQKFLNYMQEHDLKTFYLFTDSSCNYGFYEHKGVKRLAHRTFMWRPYEKNKAQYPEEYYLYGSKLNNARTA